MVSFICVALKSTHWFRPKINPLILFVVWRRVLCPPGKRLPVSMAPLENLGVLSKRKNHEQSSIDMEKGLDAFHALIQCSLNNEDIHFPQTDANNIPLYNYSMKQTCPTPQVPLPACLHLRRHGMIWKMSRKSAVFTWPQVEQRERRPQSFSAGTS